jgi:hypothetical protein
MGFNIPYAYFELNRQTNGVQTGEIKTTSYLLRFNSDFVLYSSNGVRPLNNYNFGDNTPDYDNVVAAADFAYPYYSFIGSFNANSIRLHTVISPPTVAATHTWVLRYDASAIEFRVGYLRSTTTSAVVQGTAVATIGAQVVACVTRNSALEYTTSDGNYAVIAQVRVFGFARAYLNAATDG